MIVTVCLWILAAIGFTLVVDNLWFVVKELYRAAKQSHRIATIISREYGTRHTTYKQWWYCFKDEVFSYYTNKYVGNYRVDYDPNVKVTRRRW